MMARFRRTSLRPVNRIKHVVDFSFTAAAASQVNTVIISANDAPVLANRAEVLTGSTVNAIYARVEVSPNETDAGAIPNAYMIITKDQGGNITIPTANAVGSDDNKRFVIHQEMVMLNNLAGGNPRTIFNGVVVIPKGYRRFGPNDELTLSVFSTAVNMAWCAQVHYKEFR